MQDDAALQRRLLISMFLLVFYKGYSEEELARLEKALKEEIRKLPEFEETGKDVGIKMVAWIGFAWK